MPSWNAFDFLRSATKRPPAKPFKRATVATTPPERDFITLAQRKDVALQGWGSLWSSYWVCKDLLLLVPLSSQISPWTTVSSNHVPARVSFKNFNDHFNQFKYKCGGYQNVHIIYYICIPLVWSPSTPTTSAAPAQVVLRVQVLLVVLVPLVVVSTATKGGLAGHYHSEAWNYRMLSHWTPSNLAPTVRPFSQVA